MKKKMNKFFEVNNVNDNDCFSFKTPTNTIVSEIITIFKKMNSSVNLDNEFIELYTSDAEVFDKIDHLESELYNILSQDYRDNLVEAKNSNYDFVYFLNFLDEHEDCLCLNAKLFHKEPTDIGTVYYTMYLKKTESVYYLWSF